MAARAMRINSARGLLREFGFVFAAGASALPDHVQALIENAEEAIPMLLRDLLHEVVLEIGELEARIQTVETHLEALARQTPVLGRLRTIPGVGLLTATALVGFVGDVARFPSGRHFACYLGLTPREHSSGGRRSFGRISKRGDVYLWMLLIHGARAVLWAAKSKADPDRFRSWALDVQKRRGHNKAAIAVANKMATLLPQCQVTPAGFGLAPQPPRRRARTALLRRPQRQFR